MRIVNGAMYLTFTVLSLILPTSKASFGQTESTPNLYLSQLSNDCHSNLLGNLGSYDVESFRREYERCRSLELNPGNSNSQFYPGSYGPSRLPSTGSTPSFYGSQLSNDCSSNLYGNIGSYNYESFRREYERCKSFELNPGNSSPQFYPGSSSSRGLRPGESFNECMLRLSQERYDSDTPEAIAKDAAQCRRSY